MVGREVQFLEFGVGVEIVFQGTSVVMPEDHPMHLHGFSFYVVGWGFGNFDKERDPFAYNLVDPPFKNTISVPKNGWVAVRCMVLALPRGIPSRLGDEHGVDSEGWSDA
ncbi:uncharacterized protein A4U43_C08F24920 [Asparagus officinalis]|nr:uncharacterized protein A4U43_C08F24920 [Asparagus officinalis]